MSALSVLLPRPVRSPFRSRSAHPSAAGQLTGLIEPNRPSFSSLIPALNSSVPVPPVAAVPKVRPHSPSMAIGRPCAPRSVPRKRPENGSYALMRPLPKLPTSSAPPKRPKLAGATVRPHGESSSPRETSRSMRKPLVVKTSTKPWPMPATSSCLSASCFA